MQKKFIVKNNREFSQIIKANRVVKNHHFLIYFLPNSYAYDRFGVSVGTKVGNAVTRNFLKRRTRNIIDQNKFDCSNKQDYIIMVRKSCLECSYQEMEQSYRYLIRKISQLKKESQNEEK